MLILPGRIQIPSAKGLQRRKGNASVGQLYFGESDARKPGDGRKQRREERGRRRDGTAEALRSSGVGILKLRDLRKPPVIRAGVNILKEEQVYCYTGL